MKGLISHLHRSLGKFCLLSLGECMEDGLEIFIEQGGGRSIDTGWRRSVCWKNQRNSTPATYIVVKIECV